MKRLFVALLLISSAIFSTSRSMAQDVLKQDLPPSIMKYLVDKSPEYSSMVRAINTAQLNELFERPGPITLFVPSNKAFEAMTGRTFEDLLQPVAIDTLKRMLTYHIVAGNWAVADLKQKIKESGGEFVLPTIGAVGKLSFVFEDGYVWVKDEHGFKTMLGVPLVEQNGMVYALDKILLPKN